MKYICTVSHEQPVSGGGYKTYVAGQEYELDTDDKTYFSPLAPSQGKVEGEGATSKVDPPQLHDTELKTTAAETPIKRRNLK